MTNELKGYKKSISEVTGETDITRIRLIENCMRDDIFHSTLDWQSLAQFNKGALDAVKLLKSMNEL